MIVDSHCHLNMLKEDLSIILKNSSNHQISYLQTICTKLSEFSEIKEIAHKNKNIFCSVGIHPNEVTEVVPAAKLIELSKDPKVIGIGETGLDYYYDRAPATLQKQSFIEHIKAARETGLPLIIHSRDADADMMNILESETKIGPFPALLHCFSSSETLAKKALDLGVYISLSGIVTFKNALELQNIAKTLPLDKILVETDSPYLAPTPMRGKTNQPAYTKYVVQFLAELRETSFDLIAKQTTDNFFKLFSKATR